MTSFALASETFRTTNRQAAAELFQCVQLSVDGGSVQSSDGTTILPHKSIAEESDLDLVFVCANAGAAHFADVDVKRWLQGFARRGVPLGAFSSGAFVLARFGLLNQHVCTIHWDDADAFREMYPAIELTDNVYVISGDRFTCAGGTASVDMLLHLVSQSLGADLAARVADEFIIDRPRPAKESQIQHRRMRRQALSPVLQHVIDLMQVEADQLLGLERSLVRRVFPPASCIDCLNVI